MDYVNKMSSLEEKASAQVAVNLCQEPGFKAVAMCLEKPTYGFLLPHEYSRFVSDPGEFSLWAKIQENDWSIDDFKTYLSRNDKEITEQWETAVDEQCRRLTEGIPHSLKEDIHALMYSIALEYLSYSRRLEALFHVSRYFLITVLTKGDWDETGRLDERKMALRLIEDDRLTVLQRYRIACVYCLYRHIPELWKRLDDKDISLIKEDLIIPPQRQRLNLYFQYHTREILFPVLLWSYHMSENQEEKLTDSELWTYATQQAVCYGNLSTLITCWKMLNEHTRQEIVIDMILQSAESWQFIKMNNNKLQLCSYKYILIKSFTSNLEFMQCPMLPSYYSELVHFFLSQMCEDQQLVFFRNSFENRRINSVLECFLDYPFQNDFLPMINRLWGILSKDQYKQCVLTLARKYSGDDERENRHYDYRALLRTLWETTPEEYRKGVFNDFVFETDYNVSYEFLTEKMNIECLPKLLDRSPFQKEDEALFKLIFRDQPQEKRREMILSGNGEYICFKLLVKEKWSFLKWLLGECLSKEEIPCFKKQFIQSQYGQDLCCSKLAENCESFVNWLLEECLSKEEIPSFKKQFIQSGCSQILCCSKLVENCESFVEYLIDWALECDTDKTQFKHELMQGNQLLCQCKSLLRKGEFIEVERMMNFCESSDEMIQRYKKRLAELTCRDYLEDYLEKFSFDNCVWDQMNRILTWSLDSEENLRDIKRDILSFDSMINIHYEFVFNRRNLEEVERFYKWFELSTAEVKELKKNTVFVLTEKVVKYLVLEFDRKDLSPDLAETVESVLWGLTDEEKVIDFINRLHSNDLVNIKWIKKQIGYAVSELELLCGFKKKSPRKNELRRRLFKNTEE